MNPASLSDGSADAPIDAAHEWLAEERRGDLTVAERTTEQIREQMSLAVARVMAEGSLYDADLAALAIKQSRGELIEAIFLTRAYRATLPGSGIPNRLIQAQWPATGGSQRPSKMFPAVRFQGQHLTTLTVSWTSNWRWSAKSPQWAA